MVAFPSDLVWLLERDHCLIQDGRQKIAHAYTWDKYPREKCPRLRECVEDRCRKIYCIWSFIVYSSECSENQDATRISNKHHTILISQHGLQLLLQLLLQPLLQPLCAQFPPSSRTRSSICRASHVHSAHIFGDANSGVRILGPSPQRETRKD